MFKSVHLPYRCAILPPHPDQEKGTVTSCQRLWRYELNGRSRNTYSELEIWVVEAATGEPVGLVVHIRGLWDGEPCVLIYELKDGASW